MIIIRKLSLVLFFTLLIRVANAITETTSAIDNASATATVESATASLGTYFAGIIGIVLSISIGYGLKRIYDARRESY